MGILTAVFIGIVILACIWFAFKNNSRSEQHTVDLAPEPTVEKHPLLASYNLSKHDTEFFGVLQESTVSGQRVAFQIQSDILMVYVGNFDPDIELLTDIYLGKVSERQLLPEQGSSQRLDPYVDGNSKLATQYFLLATGATEYPILCSAAVETALSALSQAVIEVGFFEEPGMSLTVDLAQATQQQIDSDVQQLVAILDTW